MAKKKLRSPKRLETPKTAIPKTPEKDGSVDIAELRGALRDLLAYYDRLLEGRDFGGWSHADGARIAEIRDLAK